MTRIEKQEDVKEEIAKMKEEMVREMQRTTRKHRPFITCSLIVIGLFLTAAIWVAWIVAGTGLVHVPMFTSFAYEKPEPTRIVEAGVPLQELIGTELQTVLAERLQAGDGELLDKTVQLEAPEGSLTATLRSGLEELGISYVDTAHSQVTVHQDAGFEMYFPLKNNPQETALVIFFHAESHEDSLVLVLKSVEIGSVSFPSFILTHVFEPALNRYTKDLSSALSVYTHISDFSYYEGWVDIRGEFAVEFEEKSAL